MDHPTSRNSPETKPSTRHPLKHGRAFLCEKNGTKLVKQWPNLCTGSSRTEQAWWESPCLPTEWVRTINIDLSDSATLLSETQQSPTTFAPAQMRTSTAYRGQRLLNRCPIPKGTKRRYICQHFARDESDSLRQPVKSPAITSCTSSLCVPTCLIDACRNSTSCNISKGRYPQQQHPTQFPFLHPQLGVNKLRAAESNTTKRT